jgi:hypothetical protein
MFYVVEVLSELMMTKKINTVARWFCTKLSLLCCFKSLNSVSYAPALINPMLIPAQMYAYANKNQFSCARIGFTLRFACVMVENGLVQQK